MHAEVYRGTYSHPEKLKEGEEQYRNSHPEQGRRSTYSNSTTSTTIRNNNSNVNSRRSVGTETSDRNTDEGYNVNIEREQRTLKDENTTRRIATEATRSIITNSNSGRTISEGRTPTEAAARPASRPEQSQQATARPAARPEQNQNVSQPRSQVQTRTESVSQERRGGGEEKQVKGNGSIEKSNTTESSGTPRRK